MEPRGLGLPGQDDMTGFLGALPSGKALFSMQMTFQSKESPGTYVSKTHFMNEANIETKGEKK